MNSLKTVMITHYQSSGSLYLHSLFDGHPQIITIPGVPELDTIINGRFNNAQEALNEFYDTNPKFFDTLQMTLSDLNTSGLQRLGKNADEGIITDKNIFSQSFYECIDNYDITPRNVIISLYYAYANSHGLDLNKKKIVLFHPHEVHRTISMNAIFPGSQYLVTIRHPARSYYSRLQRNKDKAKVRNIAYSHLGLLYADANNVHEFLKNNLSMRILRIEDFNKYSHIILRKLCDYLKIDYDVSLEKSTFGTKLYWGANPNYKSNKFSKNRHVMPISAKKHELLLFHTMNRQLNRVTGYSTIQVSWYERKLSILWLFLPFSEDIDWLKRVFYYNQYKGLPDYSGKKPFRIILLLKLIKERFKLLKIYIRNLRSKENYDLINQFIIIPSAK